MPLRNLTRFPFKNIYTSSEAATRSRRRPALCRVEGLEGRELLSTFTVSNLNAAGTGSLRWALIEANSHPGPDTINFSQAGTIKVGRNSLPAITGPVNIDGSSAPSFAGTPLVTVDLRGGMGFRFDAGSDGSVLTSVSIVRAASAGVTLNASHITVQGNYIGVLADGRTPAGNRGDGVRINSTSHNNLIGALNPVTGVTYYNANSVGMQPVSGWQGIRNSSTPGQYLITGTSNNNGLLYIGPISGASGTSYPVNYPSSFSTSVYGPDIVQGNVLRLVGSYRATQGGTVQGFVFQGTTADLTQASAYRTINYPNATYVYVHSTMGDFAVGNADGPEGNAPLGTGHAFVYSVSQGQIVTDVVYPGSTSTTAYGIWYNGGTSYTITGGYTLPGQPITPFAAGYLVDYDSSTGQFTHWTSLSAPGGLAGNQAFATHFEGISSPQAGVYTLATGLTALDSTTPLAAAVATVRRNADGTFGPTVWQPLAYPGASGTTSDAVAGYQDVGIAFTSTGVVSYQATVNLNFQLSNVISANLGNGVGVYGANDNRIAMNNVGTDASGTIGLGNFKNGIQLTNGAARNFIGGAVSGGNNPTKGVIVRPPQGNQISANRLNGVLIDQGATANFLSGNFIGTDSTGNRGLGNRLDGVAIDHADGNNLIGCTMQDDPFVFYNVISANGGNGVRVTSSNNTTIHANFMGTAANNTKVLPNARDGLLVNGTSANTQVGGVIPLGNVISGNLQNGIEVRDRATGFVSFNTFGGTFAFGGAAPNGRDGILITSAGGNNLIRTCILSGNRGNGIEIGGNASGVQVTDTSTGTNTGLQYAIPNGGNGILVTGRAHNNAIGGFQPSVEPTNTVSGNRLNGIAFQGAAHDNEVVHTVIGSSALNGVAIPNGLNGVYVGPGTSRITIGGIVELLENSISNSGGDGVKLVLSNGDTVTGNDIFSNSGNGLRIQCSRQTTVGTSDPNSGNSIDHNQAYGVLATGVCDGSIIQNSVIVTNGLGNVNLSRARGITYIPKPVTSA
jgi:hypothetical protein